MKSLLAFLWKRHWCRFVGAGLILCALPLLHPFIRQSIFGPTIQGIPWCVWEDEVRMAVDPDRKESWFQKKLQEIGVLQPRDAVGLAMLPRQSLFGPTIRGKAWCFWDHEIRHFRRPRPKPLPFEWRIRGFLGVWEKEWEFQELFDHEEMLPLVLELTADEDPAVRNLARNAILNFDSLQKESALPFLREQLDEFAATYRVAAAKAIWRLSKDRAMNEVALDVLNQAEVILPGRLLLGPQPSVRSRALSLLGEIACNEPGRLPTVIGYADDGDYWVRQAVADSLRKFGPRAQAWAPVLEKMLSDGKAEVRLEAAAALEVVDPLRFQDWKAERRAGPKL
jgi:hypothetical protein